MEQFVSRPRRLAPLAVLLAGMAAGCGAERDDEPAAATVDGKVTIKGAEGQVPRLDGSQVRAKSAADPSKELVGRIDSDGAFSLGLPTPAGAAPAELPPGEYVARIVPAAEDRKTVRELPIKPKYLGYATSGLRFSLPATGEVLIELERGR